MASVVTLVGHDWGAITAWELAARYPEYLERLITFSSAPLDLVRSSVRDPLQRSRWTYQLMLTSPQAEQILAAGDYYLYNLLQLHRCSSKLPSQHVKQIHNAPTHLYYAAIHRLLSAMS